MSLYAGAAVVDLTPEHPFTLCGYISRSHAFESVHDPLYTKALVLRSGETEVALVANDVIGFHEDFVLPLCEAIELDTGVPRDRIIITGTHTHAGPTTISLFGFGAAEEEYLAFVRGRIVTAVGEARRNLSPACLGTGSTECHVGINRRGRNEEGHVVLGENPEGPVDRELTVIRVDGENRKPIATVLNLGCHATTMGGDNYAVSADFPGEATRILAESTGAPVLFTNGAFGNVNPAGRKGIWEDVAEKGALVAADAAKVYPDIECRSDLDLAMVQPRVQLPYAPLPSRSECEENLKRSQERLYAARLSGELGATKAALAQVQHWQLVRREVECPQPEQGLEIALPVLRLGDTAVVGFPGETFAEIALRLKELSPFPHTPVAGLANGEVGYLCTADENARGGYEPFVYQYFGAYRFADEMADLLVAKAVEILNGVTPTPLTLM